MCFTVLALEITTETADIMNKYVWWSLLGFSSTNSFSTPERTDKKVNRIFLIHKEIQKGVVAKSYLTKRPPHI